MNNLWDYNWNASQIFPHAHRNGGCQSGIWWVKCWGLLKFMTHFKLNQVARPVLWNSVLFSFLLVSSLHTGDQQRDSSHTRLYQIFTLLLCCPRWAKWILCRDPFVSKIGLPQVGQLEDSALAQTTAVWCFVEVSKEHTDTIWFLSRSDKPLLGNLCTDSKHQAGVSGVCYISIPTSLIMLCSIFHMYVVRNDGCQQKTAAIVLLLMSLSTQLVSRSLQSFDLWPFDDIVGQVQKRSF